MLNKKVKRKKIAKFLQHIVTTYDLIATSQRQYIWLFSVCFFLFFLVICEVFTGNTIVWACLWKIVLSCIITANFSITLCGLSHRNAFLCGPHTLKAIRPMENSSNRWAKRNACVWVHLNWVNEIDYDRFPGRDFVCVHTRLCSSVRDHFLQTKLQWFTHLIASKENVNTQKTWNQFNLDRTNVAFPSHYCRSRSMCVRHVNVKCSNTNWRSGGKR